MRGRFIRIAEVGRENWQVFVLSLMGIVLFGLYRYGLELRFGLGIKWFIKVACVQAAIYFLACWFVLRNRSLSRSPLWLIIGFAVLFRLAVLFHPPYLSDDIYRYIWDGRVQAAGINPYRYIPADQALEFLRDDAIYPKINRKDYAHTIYPPMAQGFFFLVTRFSESVVWMKLAFVLCEFVTMAAILYLLRSFHIPLQRVLLYAWNPLVIWDFAGNGHVDALSIAFIMLALLCRRKEWNGFTGLFLGFATLVKIFPIVLFPALYKRWDWKMPAALCAAILTAYLPYLSVGIKGVFGFLPDYLQEEGIQTGTRFFLLDVARSVLGENWAPELLYKVIAIAALGAISIWFVSRRTQSDQQYLINSTLIATLFMVLLSPRYGWYFSWLVPFICFVPSMALIYLTCSSFLLYALWFDNKHASVILVNSLIYFPFFAFVALSLLARKSSFMISNRQGSEGQA
jgi:alpha-1,6-mannosyltransferase